MGKRSTTVVRDLVLVAVFLVVAFALAHNFDLFERLAALTRRYEAVQLDEIFAVLIAASFAFAFFSFRRWKESAREVAEHERAEEDLRGRERELAAFNDRLRRQADDLRRRASQLARANRLLQERKEENEMFVYSVSHDLRSPLVNLQGFSQELSMVGEDLRGLLSDEELPGRVREHGLATVDEDMGTAIHFIQTGVTCLSNIIDALLRLSRAGRVEYHWQWVDVNAVVGRTADAARATKEEKGAKVVVEGGLPSAWGDAAAVEQLFANLVGNALKYLDEGRPGLVEVGGEESDGDFNTYYVKDNGVGISEGQRAKVFQVFQRLGSGTEGEGLGLTLVRRTAERHGGRVWVESAEGEGSTFFVQLPASPKGQPASDPAHDEPVSTSLYRDS